MATREENLKKINDKLEKLSDDELEKIAGGVWKPRTEPRLGNNDAQIQETDYAPNNLGIKKWKLR